MNFILNIIEKVKTRYKYIYLLAVVYLVPFLVISLIALIFLFGNVVFLMNKNSILYYLFIAILRVIILEVSTYIKSKKPKGFFSHKIFIVFARENRLPLWKILFYELFGVAVVLNTVGLMLALIFSRGFNDFAAKIIPLLN